ncbi:MAG TPA: hypothetical protein VN616_07325 [Puia sp.]|nr:hypothetical protein [Puia sp.]
MKKLKKPPGKQIAVWLSPDEFERVHADLGRSTCRSLSEYARKRILGRPIRFKWRNQSFDGFVDEIVVLRRTMDDLNARPEWTPDERNRLADLYGEVKAVVNKIVDVCTPT